MFCIVVGAVYSGLLRSRHVRDERVLCEREIIHAVESIRWEDSCIGAYKLHLMIKEVFPEAVPPRACPFLSPHAREEADAQAPPANGPFVTRKRPVFLKH